MELLFSRSQKSGLVGGVKFSLTAKVRLTPEESGHIKLYKMSDIVVYEKGGEKLKEASGMMSLIAARAMLLRVTVSDLVNGKTIECKDIVEIMAAQDQIKEATRLLQTMLSTAHSFTGEEVITFA